MTAGVGHHQVVFEGGAQLLVTVPLNRQARPTPAMAATFRVVDLRLAEDDTTRLIASGAATRDATTATTTAACGLGTARAREVPVTSSAGFAAGKRYLITDAAGTREIVLAEAVTTGLVRVRDEIARRFDTGVTLRGIEVSCSFPSLEAANESSLQDQGGPYAVDWSWDVDPSPRREVVFIVRRADGLAITEEELLAVDPTLAAATGNRLTLATAIRTAAQEVRAMLQARQVDPDNFHGSTSMRLAVAYRAAWHVLRHKDGDANTAKATASKEEAQLHLDNLLLGRSPEKTVTTDPSTDTARAGSDATVKHWQRIS